MANVDRPSGAKVYGPLLRQGRYEAGSAIYPGDFVKLSADGQIDRCASSDASVGVAMEYASAAGVSINVADHPDQKFVIQKDGVGAGLSSATGLFRNYAIVDTSGDTTYLISRMELDQSASSVSAGNTFALRAIAALDPENDPLTNANADIIVTIANHQLGKGTIGV